MKKLNLLLISFFLISTTFASSNIEKNLLLSQSDNCYVTVEVQGSFSRQCPGFPTIVYSVTGSCTIKAKSCTNSNDMYVAQMDATNCAINALNIAAQNAINSLPPCDTPPN